MMLAFFMDALSVRWDRSASSETKRSGRGEPPPRPEHQLGLPIRAGPNSVRVTAPTTDLIDQPDAIGHYATADPMNPLHRQLLGGIDRHECWAGRLPRRWPSMNSPTEVSSQTRGRPHGRDNAGGGQGRTSFAFLHSSAPGRSNVSPRKS